jgi:hypothetical protein
LDVRRLAYRPDGVIVLSVFFIIIAVLGVIGAVAIEAVIVTASQSTLTSNIAYLLGIIFLIPYSPFPIPPELIEYLVPSIASATAISISTSLSNIAYLHIATFVILVAVALYIITAVGLLQMKAWGRYLALIMGIFDIIAGIITSFIGVGILILIFGILILIYLTGDVKYEFE